jgi:ankyrin repeat protein
LTSSSRDINFVIVYNGRSLRASAYREYPMLTSLSLAHYWFNWPLMSSLRKKSSIQPEKKKQKMNNLCAIEAAKSGKISILREEIVTSENKDQICRKGYSLLHHSAIHGHHACVKYLIELGAKVNIHANGGTTPLHRAANTGCIETISHLVKAGANIHAADCNGHTPLHAAARFGHSAIVHFLMTLGANVRAQDRHGFTPLDEAIKYRQRETVITLIDS